MGEQYPYLRDKSENIKEIIRLEEERFFKTIASGLELFNQELKKGEEVFSGDVAFKLYDTYGFPLDLTEDMLREVGKSVDIDRFDSLMSEQRKRAKAAWKGSGDAAVSGDFKELLEEFGENEFVGYEKIESNSKVLALLDIDFKRVDKLNSKDEGWIFLDTTPFYAQSGGQVGDSGEVRGVGEILDTQKFFDLNLSHIKLSSNLSVGDDVKVVVSHKRREIRRHHSATHLLQVALKDVLGDHIAQAGSLNDDKRLRFDFSHPKALTKEEIEKVEEYVQNIILKGVAAKTEVMSIEDAKNSGAVALFGE
jgi:alanyl-tRNA synthetase